MNPILFVPCETQAVGVQHCFSTYIGMELMAYTVVKSRALPAPLAANLLLCEIALHA